MKKYAIGIDLGGTNFRFAIITKDGKILNYRKIKAPNKEKVALEIIKKSLKEIVFEEGLDFNCDILGIGIAIASAVNSKTGKVDWNKKMPFSKNFDILKILRKEFKKPVFVENDMNAEALAEMKFGNLKRIKNALILTISTGIGSAIILNRKIYKGSNFSAGEVGHMVLDPFWKKVLCNRGETGCWEAFCSGKSLEKRYFLKYRKNLSAKEIVKFAKAGDKKSLKILEEITIWLGVGLVNIINILDPEVIIIYGDYFLEIWPILEKGIKKIIKKRAFNPEVSFKKTALGDNGCLLGAALLVFEGNNL